MKVATNETQKFDITIIEMKFQSKLTDTISHKTLPNGRCHTAAPFCMGKGAAMAKIDGLTLEAKVDVSDEVAAACVAILNLYLKENDVVDVMGEKIDGHYQIHLINRATSEQ